MADDIASILASFRGTPLQQPLTDALKALAEKAADGLTAEEVNSFVEPAEKLLKEKMPDGKLKTDAEILLNGFKANAGDLIKVGPDAQKALNGYVAIIEAKTEEEAKEAARKAQAAAPDFFTAIISLFLGLLGFSQEQINQFTGAMNPKVEEPAPAAAETAPPAATTSAPAADASASTMRTPTRIEEVGRARAPLPNTPEARALVQTARYIYEESKYRSDLLAETPKRSLDEITTKSQSTQSTQTREDYYTAAFKANGLQTASGTSWNGLPGAGGGLGVAAIGAGAGYGTAAGVTALMGGVSTTATTGVAATLATAGVSLTGTGVGAVVGVPLIVAGGVIGVSSAVTARSNAVDGAAIIDYNGIENDLNLAQRAEKRAKKLIEIDPANAYLGLDVQPIRANINDQEVLAIRATIDSTNSPMAKDARAIGIKAAETEFLKALEDGVMPKYDKAALVQKKTDLNVDGKRAEVEKLAAQKEALLAQMGQAKALEELNQKLANEPHLARSTAGWWKSTLSMGLETDASNTYIQRNANNNVEAALQAQDDIKKQLTDLQNRQNEAVKELAEAYRDEGKLNKQIEFAEDKNLAAEVKNKHKEILQIEIDKENKRIADEKAAKEEAAKKAKEAADAQKLREIATQAAAAGISNAPAAGAMHHSGGTGAPYGHAALPREHMTLRERYDAILAEKAEIAGLRKGAEQVLDQLDTDRALELFNKPNNIKNNGFERKAHEALFKTTHKGEFEAVNILKAQLAKREADLRVEIEMLKNEPGGAQLVALISNEKEHRRVLGNLNGDLSQSGQTRNSAKLNTLEKEMAGQESAVAQQEAIDRLKVDIKKREAEIKQLDKNIEDIQIFRSAIEKSFVEIKNSIQQIDLKTEKVERATAALALKEHLQSEAAKAGSIGAHQTAQAFARAADEIQRALKDGQGISNEEMVKIKDAAGGLDKARVQEDLYKSRKTIDENNAAIIDDMSKLSKLGVRSKAAPKDDEKQEKKPTPTPQLPHDTYLASKKDSGRSNPV